MWQQDEIYMIMNYDKCYEDFVNNILYANQLLWLTVSTSKTNCYNLNSHSQLQTPITVTSDFKYQSWTQELYSISPSSIYHILNINR